MKKTAKPSTHPLISSFARSLFADQKMHATIDHYAGAARQFADFADDEIPTRQSVRDWMAHLREDGYSAATINNRWRGLRAYCKWLTEEREVDRDPMAGMSPPPLEETHKDVATAREIADVLKRLEKAKLWRDYATIAILYDTGMRATELCTARMDDLDMQTGTLLVRHAKGRRMRVVRLSPQALRAVDRCHRHVDSEYVTWGQRGQLTRSGLRVIVKRAFERAGIDRAVFGPHDLRHTSASHVASAQLLSESDAMELYGWKKSEMWRHYTEQARREAALKAHETASPLTRLLSEKAMPRNQRRGI